MKKRILCLAVLASLTLTMLCGCGSKNNKESSEQKSKPSETSQASQVSAKSEQPDESSEESAESAESAESEEPSKPVSPSKPASPSVDMKFWGASELEELVGKSKIENLTVTAAEYAPVAGSDTLYCTTAEISVTGLFDDVLSLSDYLSKQEKNNIYINGFSLSVDYNNDMTAVIKVINPYPVGEEFSEDELKEYIAVRWNSVDKNGAIAAFIDENSNYYLKTAECDFTPAEDGSITFLAGIDFSTYNGFVAYRYKLSRSENFILSDNVSVQEKSEDYYDDKAFHADVLLTTNKFNK